LFFGYLENQSERSYLTCDTCHSWPLSL